MFPYVCKDLLIFHISAVLFPSLSFFIFCQCSFISRYFHSSSTTLSLTMLLYSLHVCSSLSFHTHILGSNFLRLFCCVKPHVRSNNLCFGTHASFGMILRLRTLDLIPLPYNNIVNCTFGRTSYICHQLRFLLHDKCIADD